MAFSDFIFAGGAGHTTSASSFTIATTQACNLANRHYLILNLVLDNSDGGEGDLNQVLSVTGGNGTWYKCAEHTNGRGAAAGGVTVSSWLFRPSGSNPSGTSITITLDAAVVDKYWRLNLGTCGIGLDVSIDPTFPVERGQNIGVAGYPSLSVSGAPNKYRNIIRVSGKEANSATAQTNTSGWMGISGTRSRNNANAVRMDGEHLRDTSTGATSSPTSAIVGDTADIMYALHEDAPVEDDGQTLTPSLYTNSQTFYGPTVTAGVVSLTPPLLTNTSSFYAATVSQVQTLLPALLTNTQSFFAPSVSAGAVTLSPSLVSNGQTFYAATVTRGAVPLSPALLTNNQTFPSASITASYSLTPSLLSNAQAFYGPTVTRGAVSLTPPLLSNAQTFFAPSVSQGGGSLSPPLVVNSQTFFAPVVTARATLTPARLNNSQSFYAPAIAASNDVAPPLLVNGNQFFSPTLSQGPANLRPGLFVNGNVIFAASVFGGDRIYGPPRNDDRTIYGAARSDDVTITGPARNNSIQVAA